MMFCVKRDRAERCRFQGSMLARLPSVHLLVRQLTLQLPGLSFCGVMTGGYFETAASQWLIRIEAELQCSARPARRGWSPGGPCGAARSRLWVAISAASRDARTIATSVWKTCGRRCAGRGCRSARRPAAGAARWPRRGRWRRAAARRRRVRPAGARGARPGREGQELRRALLRLALRQAADELRHHHVLQRRELRQEMVELVDEADFDRGGARCAPGRPLRGRLRRRHRPRRHRAFPAGPRYGAGSTCRCPRARSARRLARPDREVGAAQNLERRRRPGDSGARPWRGTGPGSRPGAVALIRNAALRRDRAGPPATTG